MMLILGTLSAIYVIPTIYKDYIKMEQESGLDAQKDLNVVGNKFAKNAVEDIKKKAQDFKGHLQVSNQFRAFIIASISVATRI